ncbi:hypothetical protein [Aquimarina agarivorans]|uniref:hypothetical protein n=1 Tax=Aquimarina agarivorans TaxID=980584 RepID=UPI00031F1E48|nr:hypothetical protein [Aquimarina agarivorans]
MATPFVFMIDQIFKILIINKQPIFYVSENENDQIEIELSPKNSIDHNIKKAGYKVTTISLGAVNIPFYIMLFIYGFFNVLFVWVFTLLF